MWKRWKNRVFLTGHFFRGFFLGIYDNLSVFSRVFNHLWVLADFAATIHRYQVAEVTFCEEKCSKRMANRSQTKRSISAHTATVWHFACVQIVAIYLMIALHRAAPTVLPQHTASPSAGEGRGPHFLLHCPPPVSCRFISRSVTPGKAAPSSRRLTSPQSCIRRQLTAGRMIHDTHTIDVFAHFLQHRCAAVSCTEFQGKVRRMKSIFGTINCGIIITMNNNSVSGDVGFVEKLTKYRFFFPSIRDPSSLFSWEKTFSSGLYCWIRVKCVGNSWERTTGFPVLYRLQGKAVKVENRQL